MTYAKTVSNLYERPQVFDNLQKTSIEYENFVIKKDYPIIKNEKRAVKGIILGLIVSIPIWFLIISFMIWVIS